MHASRTSLITAEAPLGVSWCAISILQQNLNKIYDSISHIWYTYFMKFLCSRHSHWFIECCMSRRTFPTAEAPFYILTIYKRWLDMKTIYNCLSAVLLLFYIKSVIEWLLQIVTLIAENYLILLVPVRPSSFIVFRLAPVKELFTPDAHADTTNSVY